EAGKPPTPPQLILDLFTNRLNHTEVKMAALFDLLFSQCDRHQQNIFLTEKGKLWVIDNDQVHTTAWRRCGIDSMLLPTTQKFMINHLGFFYVLKYPQKDPPQTWTKNPNPLVLLDYRCHVDGGAIGKRFFPKLEQCMRHIGSMQAAEIQALYGYPNIRMSDAIRNRSTDMLSKGYEWTLLYGQPTNQAMHRYKIAPPCCAMHLVGKDRRCTHATVAGSRWGSCPMAIHGTEGTGTARLGGTPAPTLEVPCSSPGSAPHCCAGQAAIQPRGWRGASAALPSPSIAGWVGSDVLGAGRRCLGVAGGYEGGVWALKAPPWAVPLLASRTALQGRALRLSQGPISQSAYPISWSVYSALW
ncbi:hypothetical protein QJQ45_019883, partial [Haematococcus lacustris]